MRFGRSDQGAGSHLFTTPRSERGAAFLLAIYLAAMMFLLLGGVSLQRTITEVRASEVSRDMQQAFFVAEGGIDLGLRTAVRDGTYTTNSLGAGNLTYTVSTSKLEVLSPQRLRSVQTITSTGTDAGRRAGISATRTLEQVPLPGGVYANGVMQDPRGGCGGWLWGDAHTGLGTPLSGLLNHPSYPSDRIFGNLSVSPPDSAHPYTDLWGIASSSGGFVYGTNPAIVFHTGFEIPSGGWTPKTAPKWLKKNRVSGTVAVSELPQIQPIETPVAIKHDGAARNLTLQHADSLVSYLDGLYRDDAASMLAQIALNPAAWGWRASDVSITQIYDGDAIDRSPAGDGKIVLRLRKLQIWPYAQLLLHAPAQIYVEQTDQVSPSWFWPPPAQLPSTDITTAAYIGKMSTLVALDPAGHTIKNGVKLLVTAQSAGTPGAVLVDAPGAFFGSVWAPESAVAVVGKSYNDPTPDVRTAIAAGTIDPYAPTSNTWTVQSDGKTYVNTTNGPSIADSTNLCRNCPGGLEGTELGYVVAKDVYLAGELHIGTARNTNPLTNDYWDAVAPNASDFGTVDGETDTTTRTTSALIGWKNTRPGTSP